MTFSSTLRSRLLTAVAIAAAVLVWYGLISAQAQRARTSCTERGGALVLDLDERGVSYVQWCVLPNATRERI